MKKRIKGGWRNSKGNRIFGSKMRYKNRDLWDDKIVVSFLNKKRYRMGFLESNKKSANNKKRYKNNRIQMKIGNKKLRISMLI